MAAAKSYIRSRLLEDGLLDRTDDDEIVEIRIAEAWVKEEIS